MLSLEEKASDGSQKCRSTFHVRCCKREADAYERRKKAEAFKQVEEEEKRGREPMTFGAASTRYWEEVAQHQPSAVDAEWCLA
ncbi:hypothetical protein DC522_12525 [Microvirga sp. KLBC 81]|nr:hypothetical protein DC522_12525 [Microvirga sp. KLBC 81]